MKIKNSILLALIAMISFTTEPVLAQSRSKKGKTIHLFDGKSLNGWYKYLSKNGRDNDPLNVFSVHDKMIHITGEEYGCITTLEQYENYKLTVEFKWGTKTFEPRVDRARDNGVLIHSQGKDGAFSKSWMYSIECQIIEGGTGDFLVVGDGSKTFELTSKVAPRKTGGPYVFDPNGSPATINLGRIDWFGRDPGWKDVLGFRGARDVEKPTGEWNKMEVIAKGDEVTIYVNGVLVNQATNVKPSRGHIQIQSEGAEMFVRKIDLKPL